jgi:selenide, water dikinase
MPDGARLLLAGLGHAHLFVLEALVRGRLPRVRPVLVCPEDAYYYSGMVSGVVAGCYPREAACLRPAALAYAAGAEWVRASVARVDASAGRVELDGGQTLEYDLLSLSVGSRLKADELRGSGEHGVPVKPFHRVLGVAQEVSAALRRLSADRPARIVVVGGGAGGFEVGICLDAALAREHGRGRYRMVILEGGDTVLAEHPERVRARGRAHLRERGIEVRTGCRVVEARPGEVVAEDGATVPHDVLVWGTGPRAPELFRDSRLPTDDEGYLRVRATLRVDGQPRVFGAGDCVAIGGRPWVPKAGVYAVREGGVLARNLAAQLRGEPLEEYAPQRHWLSLMNTGDGRGLLSYRGLAAHNRLVWRLKDRIDRHFVHRFQRLGG